VFRAAPADGKGGGGGAGAAPRSRCRLGIRAPGRAWPDGSRGAPRGGSGASEVGELERDAEVPVPEQRDDGLEIVAVLA